jgi:hypothetical protein
MSCDICGTLQACPTCRERRRLAGIAERKRIAIMRTRASLHDRRAKIAKFLATNADKLTRDDVNAFIASLEAVRENWYPLPETTDRTG